MDPLNHRAPVIILALVAAPVLELLRRVFGSPAYGDVRSWAMLAAGALAIAAAILFVLTFALRFVNF
jgi:hypothetical protein